MTNKNNKLKTNDFVVRFANTNGTGSASANHMFAKAIMRMGIPVSAKNIFPSNIQGSPTWYEVRINERGFLGRREGPADIMVAMNSQSFYRDLQDLKSGSYLLYDNSREPEFSELAEGVTTLGIPIAEICLKEYQDPRLRQLFKNVIYVGALAALLDIEFDVLKSLVSDQFKGKEKLITPNIFALELGYQYAHTHFQCPLPFRVERRDLIGEQILVDGNTGCALGSVYAGATVVGWYPITPSTSVIEKFASYCERLRIDPATGKKNYAIVQAEDELAAIGIALGGGWNGARSFTATSGPGVSLMTEFLGLSYFAEVPVVLMNIQRAGPSTGMPTRTQQSDILACAYASHGDTKHVLLFPKCPTECFELTTIAFDLADRLQTAVILMSDLDLGMNDHLCQPFQWDDDRQYDLGKVLSEEQLEALSHYGRYQDVDDDGICPRTLAGTHPNKGAFFTRGTSRNRNAVYSERSEDYVDNMERLEKKFKTAASLVPEAQITQQSQVADISLIYFGTSAQVIDEVIDKFQQQDLTVDTMRIRAFPFGPEVAEFIRKRNNCYVIEQNRDAQMRTLLINELDASPHSLVSVLNYDGLSLTADAVVDNINNARKIAPIRQRVVKGGADELR
ncbi:2-oxoacid:acceptor oxidoreductase subunit alpha [Thalassotalea sp. PS06]|uniref:2-oxoacid:acceptor oxidoreductase subunit alpha n=1 Tax=Thalassotalea sp. PS06 TaxID=2594005 RepID=UPI0011634779|nr:2-oxoacid:acceptor oxidoreductase subunit alpha [Thalassotalea sp. PS06]QDP01183.1 2-oxoacid:acceptor oxidoreductase subunit alpha [Thalassotalea sp. PS06]